MSTVKTLTFDGFKLENVERNKRVDYSFPEGYEAVVIRTYFLDTLEFISESRYTNFLYRSSLKTLNKLKEAEEAEKLTYCVTTLNKVVHYGSHKEAFEAYEVTESPKAVYELDCIKGTCKGINIYCNLHDYEFMHLQEKMRMRNFKIIS